MSKNQEFSQFKVVHQLKRRIRIIAPGLYKEKEYAYILQILLMKRKAIEKVKIVSTINSVTIYFDPKEFPVLNLLNLLESVLANFSKKPRESFQKIADGSAQHSGKKQQIVFGIGGMSCASCALFLEMVLLREKDILQASVNYVSETATIDGYLDKHDIFKVIETNGYQAYSIDTLEERKILLKSGQQHLLLAKNRLLMTALVEGSIIIAGIFLGDSRKIRIVQALLSLPVITLGGGEIFKKAWVQVRHGSLNMDALIATGVSSAYVVSIPALFDMRRHAYFDTAAAIISFVQLGRYLEELAKNNMVQDVEALIEMQPQNATLLNGENESRVSIDKIEIGDVLLIRPGERIAVDGLALSGLSSVNESIISGSNIPCIKESGCKLFAGTINGSGVLRMKATSIGQDTMLASLIHMIDQAQSSKLQIQKASDLWASRLMPGIMLLSAGTFVGWVLKGEVMAHAFSNALSVLLISCPCALGLAAPAATSVSSGQAAKRKIYIKNGNALETMASIDSVIFDKTGTLTEGSAKVNEFLNISDWTEEYLIQLALSVEINSEHILATAIVEFAKNKKIAPLPSAKFYSIPDQGVRSVVEGCEIMLGSEGWIKEQLVDTTIINESVRKWSEKGNTIIYMVVDNKLVAMFAVVDELRDGAKLLTDKLRQKGLKMYMLTGDTEASALPIAKLAGIESVISEASPAKKIQFIRDLQKKGCVVAMVGDGINDAPALAAANVSLVVNNATGIAIEASDYILVDGDIRKVSEVLELSQQTLSIIKQNLFWAFSYNVIAIPVAMVGKLNPMVSSAAMALSSVTVIANSLRLNLK